MIELAPEVFCIVQLVDALEIVVDVPRSRSTTADRPDELQCALDAHRRRASERASRTEPFAPFGGEPVADGAVHADRVRKGAFRIDCDGWMVGVRSENTFGPRIFVQIRADYLHQVGTQVAAASAMAWVTENLLPLIANDVAGVPSFSIRRVDLAADICGVELVESDRAYFTTRAASADVFSAITTVPLVASVRSRGFTGFTFGRHSNGLMARIYLKTTEAAADDPIREVWAEAGYTAANGPVWRIEFELTSKQLAGLLPEGALSDPLGMLATHLNTLWLYAASRWLVLRDAGKLRSRLERTPAAGWWQALADLSGFGPADAHQVTRRPRGRPSADRVYATLMGCLAVWAAGAGEATLAGAVKLLEIEGRRRTGDDLFAVKIRLARERLGLT